MGEQGLCQVEPPHNRIPGGEVQRDVAGKPPMDLGHTAALMPRAL